MPRSPVALLIATLDTKGMEAAFTAEQLRRRGIDVLLMDAGVYDPIVTADLPAGQVAAASPEGSLERLRAANDRGEAVQAMACGAAVLARRLFDAGEIQGILSIGGSAGTGIGTAAMRMLPLGIPKVMISTLASGDTRPFVQSSDICMLHSVVDVAGLNRISRTILAAGSAAMAGMMGSQSEPEDDAPLVATTMFGVTTPCVTRVRQLLEASGYEVIVFHATGAGGEAMEKLIREGFFHAVADITTTELADELVGGVLSAGPDRLTAAAKCSVPQVVVPGAIDMVNFGPRSSVPEQFRNRLLHVHNAAVTLMRTTPEECSRLGRITASRMLGTAAPAELHFPLRGVSALDARDQPFENAAARRAYLDGFRAESAGRLPVVEVDAHINDPIFAAGLAQRIQEMLAAPSGTAHRRCGGSHPQAAL